MADDARIRLTIQLIGEIAQKHVEQVELIAEAKRLLADARPDTFLGRQHYPLIPLPEDRSRDPSQKTE